MTKADFAARAAAVSAPAPQAVPGHAPRVAPVKMTVELEPSAYHFVKAFPDMMGVPQSVGKVRVPTVEVFRALLEELESSSELQRAVVARMRTNLA